MGKGSAEKSPHLETGMAHVKAGSLKAALKEFEKGSHWFEAGRVAEKLNKANKAIDFYIKAKRFSYAGKVYLAKGDFKLAAELFQQGTAHKEAAQALEQLLQKKFSLTQEKMKSSKVSRDAKELIKRIVLNYSRAQCFKDAGTWTYYLGDAVKAAEYFAQGGDYVKSANLLEGEGKLFEAAQAREEAGDFLKAGECYKKAEKFIEAGRAFEQAGSADAAVTCYRRGKRLDLAGDVFKKKQQFDVAARLYEEGEHFFEAAQCYFKLKKPENIIQCVEKMSKKDGNYRKACLLLIDSCIKVENISFQSDDYIKEFVTLPVTEKTINLMYPLAGLYEKLEFYESAQEIYQQIEKYQPGYKDTQRRLAILYKQITGSPLAIREILEQDFGYKKTSERLAALKKEEGEPIQEDILESGKEASEEIYDTSGLGRRAQPEAKVEPVQPLEIKEGAVLFGRYKVKKILGEGRSSRVCRVIDQEIDDELALKIMKQGDHLAPDLETFKKEIKLARKLSHPNIVNVYDYGKNGGHHYITMEVIEGKDLQTAIAEKGRFSVEQGMPIFAQVCKGLSAVHELGIVHRDIKPQNIRIIDENKVKILDFGLAEHTDMSVTAGRSGSGKVVAGTVAFMSPEQIRGVDLDLRSDIYSLGILAYELFTGQQPFDSKEFKALIHQQLNEQPTPPKTLNPDIPDNLQECILKCMSKNPDDRPTSCREILNNLGLLNETEREKAPKVVNDRYKIEKEIGRGAMGIVYRAFDESLQRDVALKFLPNEFSSSGQDLEGFLNEARSAARLSHMNIVTIHNIEKADQDHFIVMEYIDGLDLRTLVDEMEKLPYKSIDLICKQVCEGLGYAHKRKVFHRDIKSANILWTNDNIVKITDFGLAKIAEGVLAKSTRVQGSPAYMSPEQIMGKNVDHRTDIYSLGVTLYEITTGKIPFFKGDIAYHQLHTEAPPPKDLRPDIPAHLEKIIHRCMRKEMNERYQSVDEILTELPK